MSTPNGTTNVSMQAASNSDESSSMFPLVRILVRRRWQLLACLLLVCTVAFAATAMREPKYEAVARVQVVMDQPRISGLSGLSGGLGGDYFSTQCQLLQSRHVLAAAAENLNMPGENWNYGDEGLEALGHSVKVKPVPGSRLIDIVGISEVAPMAAAIANQITAAFIETSTDARRAATKRLIERVNLQIENYEKEILTKEDMVNKFRQEHLITGSHNTLASVETRIRSVENELTAAQMKRLDLETKRLQIEKALASGRGMGQQELGIEEINSQPDIIRLRQSLSKLSEEQLQLNQVYLANHPKLRDIRLRIADVQTQLLDQKQNRMQDLIETITEEYMITVQQEQSLQVLLNQHKQTGVMLTEQHQKFSELLADLEMTRKFRQECLAQVREFELQEGMAESPVVVIDAAQIPAKPAGLSKTHQAASILLLGILFSLAFVFALDRLSHPGESVPSMADMYRQAGMAVPYQVPAQWPNAYWHSAPQAESPATATQQQPAAAPADPMRMVSQTEATALGKLQNITLGQNSYNDLAFSARCRIVHADQSSSEAGAFREMANQLIHRFGQTPQALVITSSQAQEGKTTCASNLAIALAKAGRKVLLIDAQVDHPVLSKVFPASANNAGLSDLLMDIEPLHSAAAESDVPGLTVLAGPCSSDVLESCDTKSLENVLHDLKEPFDWIVFDTATTASHLTKSLLRVVGKCLFVTCQRDKGEQKRVAEHIEQNGAVCIGFVENAHVFQSETVEQPA